ncbi:ATP-binding protein [Salinarimonas sp.]|uniref:ATP-binding protein n=1 Tax=Salinarimonas sp. TaxID=2766526 RepID=UPI00391C40AB
MDKAARHEVETIAERLEGEAAGRPAIALDPDGRRLLHATHGARAIAEALVVDGAGRLRTDLPALARLADLAGKLPIEGAPRLERLRLAAGPLAVPSTLACRRIALDDGGAALVVVFLTPPPALAPLDRPRPTAIATRAETTGEGPAAVEIATVPEPEPESAPEPEPEPEPAPDPLARLAGRGVVRFVWSSDAQGRIEAVSPILAETVGPQAGGIVGLTLAEVLATRAHDSRGLVAEHVARGETFSGRTLAWAIDGSESAVAVDLAGLPVLDRERRLVGYRGFGLVRTDAIVPLPDALRASPQPAAEDARPDSLAEAAQEEHEEEAPVADATLEATPVAESEFQEADPVEPDLVEADAIEPVAVEAEAADEPQSDFASGEEPDAIALADVPPEAAPPGEVALDEPVAEAESVAEPSTEPESAPQPEPEPEPEPALPHRAPPPRLTSAEHNALREIAKALGARYAGDIEAEEGAPAEAAAAPNVVALAPAEALPGSFAEAALERLPLGIVVHRGEDALYANRTLLDMLGYRDLEAFREAGGLVRLLRGRPGTLARAEIEDPAPLAVADAAGRAIAVEVKIAPLETARGAASLLCVRRLPEPDPHERIAALETRLAERERRIAEAAAILDTATDGVVVIDDRGRILSLNRSAQALFGYEENEVAGEHFTMLFATESHVAALDYLDGLARGGVSGVLNDGREVTGRVRQGGAMALFMTLGRVAEDEPPKFCAVLRDMSAFKAAERDLVEARRAAEAASAQKSDFLARISHEVRTPLNAIIGFAEVMREERFGAIGNERYKDYLADIHSSGQHVLSLINDLLDLAKIEAGRMELQFGAVAVNELVAACVALMQPEAARERIVLRTSFLTRLPRVVADERSLRQIVLNLLSNAIRFTDPGGQVIVSTALTDRGEVALRVRDTGIGMSETEIEAALEPFRQLATARRAGGTGLGLPLTKALVEANRGAMTISSRKSEGTLVEVVFPPQRVMAG